MRDLDLVDCPGRAGKFEDHKKILLLHQAHWNRFVRQDQGRDFFNEDDDVSVLYDEFFRPVAQLLKKRRRAPCLGMPRIDVDVQSVAGRSEIQDELCTFRLPIIRDSRGAEPKASKSAAGSRSFLINSASHAWRAMRTPFTGSIIVLRYGENLAA